MPVSSTRNRREIERDTNRQTDRDTHRHRHRQTEAVRQRDRDRKTDRAKQRLSCQVFQLFFATTTLTTRTSFGRTVYKPAERVPFAVEPPPPTSPFPLTPQPTPDPVFITRGPRTSESSIKEVAPFECCVNFPASLSASGHRRQTGARSRFPCLLSKT